MNYFDFILPFLLLFYFLFLLNDVTFGCSLDVITLLTPAFVKSNRLLPQICWNVLIINEYVTATELFSFQTNLIGKHNLLKLSESFFKLALVPQVKGKNKVLYCVKSVQIWGFSGSYFPVFGLNTEIYGVNLRIQSENRKTRTRKSSLFRLFLRSVTVCARLSPHSHAI